MGRMIQPIQTTQNPNFRSSPASILLLSHSNFKGCFFLPLQHLILAIKLPPSLATSPADHLRHSQPSLNVYFCFICLDPLPFFFLIQTLFLFLSLTWQLIELHHKLLQGITKLTQGGNKEDNTNDAVCNYCAN